MIPERRSVSPGWVFRTVLLGSLMALSALLLGARVLHFASLSLPAALETAIGKLMLWQLLLFMNVNAHPLFQVGVVTALLVTAVVRPQWAFHAQAGHWRLRAWVRAMLWLLLLLDTAVLDSNPWVAAWCAVTLPLLAWTTGGRARSTALVVATAPAALAAGWLVSPLDAVAISAWTLLLACALHLAPRRLAAFDAFTLLVAAAAALQLAGTTAPLAWSGGGGTRLGDGYAYAFCEMPARGAVLALVTSCAGSEALDHCLGGRLSEFDATTLELRADHEPFSRSFMGRATCLVCLEDRALVGMAQTVVGGRFLREAVTEVALDGHSPALATRELCGGSVGHRMAFDPQQRVAYAVSEWSHTIVRLDVDTRVADADFGQGINAVRDPTAAGGLEARKAQLAHASAAVLLSVPGSLQTEPDAVDPRRGTVYFVEWLSGSRIFELEAATGAVRRTWDAHAGGLHSLALDPGLDRLIVSGIWGIEVFDLQSGALLARRRLGTGTRRPLIDDRHDIIYVPATYGGGLWAIDRHDYSLLGRIDLGNGGRNGLITADGERLFASSGLAHSAFDTEELAARLGRRGASVLP